MQQDAEVWTVVVAGGSGTRFGGPKQLALLAGSRVIDHAVATASAVSTGVVVAAATGVDVAADIVVPGGATRSESVRRGLEAVPDSASVVLVHDAARPLASAELYRRVIAAVVDGADAAVPAVAVTDTLRSVHGTPVDRDELLAVQTPQGFAADVLRAVHRDGAEATDDATLVDQRGGRVVVVPGDRWNLKITEPTDLVVAEALAGRKR